MNGDQLGAEANDWLHPRSLAGRTFDARRTSGGAFPEDFARYTVDFDIDMPIGQVWRRASRNGCGIFLPSFFFFSKYFFSLAKGGSAESERILRTKARKKKALSASSSEGGAPILASCSCLGRRDRCVPLHNTSLNLGMVLRQTQPSLPSNTRCSHTERRHHQDGLRLLSACLRAIAKLALLSRNGGAWQPTRVGLKWATPCTAR